MGKGLSPIQRHIVGLLDGSAKHLVYTKGKALTTRELQEELEAAGMIDSPPDSLHRKIARQSVRRSCKSLERRGLVTRSDEIDFDNEGCTIATWRLKKK